MNLTHGDSKHSTRAPEYAAWNNMLQRCENPRHGGFRRYGGRGISVCERWKQYEHFLADVGRRPTPEHSLDRINNDGNYEPGNVRWATRKQQARNQRTSRFVSAFGKKLTKPEWAEQTGINKSTIKVRLALGWNPEDAVSVEPHPKNSRITAFGRSMTLRQWSEATGINYGTIHARLYRYGWNPERALTQ